MNKLLTIATLSVCLLAGRLFGIDFDWASLNSDGSYGAVCRVTVSDARGSGWFFEYTDAKAYILTNYHVVRNNKTAVLDFWTNGVQQSINGKVVWRAYNINKPDDFCIVVVDAKELKERINPPFIPLKPFGVDVPGERFVLSAGCPRGQQVMAWKGKVIGKQGKTTLFKSHPVPGQSGSPICGVVDGKLCATDICTWLIGDENSDASTGGAIPIDNLYRALEQDGFTPTTDRYEQINDSLEPAVPLDATECAERTNLKVLYFSKPDCPSCEAIKDKVGSLRNCRKFDVSTASGYAKANKYKVSEVPCFVVLDQLDNEVLRYVGADKLIDVAALVNPVEKEIESPKEEPECDGDVCPIPEEASDYEYGDDEEYLPAPEFIEKPLPDTSFRNRPPVSEYIDASFMESNRRRWGQAEPEEKQAPEEKKDDSGKSKLGSNVSGIIDNAVNKAAGNIEKKLDEKINERIDQFKVEFQRKVVFWRFRLAILFLIIVIFGSLIANSIQGSFLWFCRKVKEFWNKIVERAALRIQSTAGKVAEKVKFEETKPETKDS